MQGLSFEVDAKALSSALSDVMRATQKRGYVPALGGVLLEAGDLGITLSATDMEIRSSVQVAGNVALNGATVIADPKSLLALVKTLKGSVSVTFDVDTLALTVETGSGARFGFETIAAADFPRPADFDGSSGQLETASLLSVLEHVVPTVSKDLSRPVLSGALIDIGDGRLTMVGTDSYRLAMDSMPVAIGETFPAGGLIVPGGALRELQRVAKRKGSPSSIGWTITAAASHHVRFTVGDYTVSARCIDGQYPKWEQLLPAEHKTEWAVSSADLAEANIRVSVGMPKGDYKPIRLEDVGDNRITVSYVGEDGSGGSETVQAERTGYPPMEIGFNPGFLADALRFCGDRARIRLISPLRPAVFLNGRDASETFHLLMPIRLAG